MSENELGPEAPPAARRVTTQTMVAPPRSPSGILPAPSDYARANTSTVDAVSGLPVAALGPAKEPSLLVITGPSMGTSIRIAEQVIIGRDPGADLPLLDRGVSWQHCRLYRVSDEQVMIEDLGSSNGTFVRHGRVTEPRVVGDGDMIRLGASTVLKLSFVDPLEAEYHRAMYDSALRDARTGLFNVRYFQERLRAEFAYASRHGTPLALCLADLDHFKLVNDTHGHPAGDLVLERFGARLRGVVRTEDVCCRYGGEEFAVLCRFTTVDTIVVLAERIRRAVEGTEFAWEGTPIPVTVSLGCASTEDDAVTTAAELVASADRALLAAKQRGRNLSLVCRAGVVL